MLRLFVLMMGLGLANIALAQEDVLDVDREPAAIVTNPAKRTYPGGADEEDLRVQNKLPDAALKTDSRTLQREVFKQLYNQELKDDRPETMEE